MKYLFRMDAFEALADPTRRHVIQLLVSGPRRAGELAEEVGIVVSADALRYAGQIIDASGPAVDHAHVFELRCEEEPALRVDGREVIWADFLSPAQALEWGLVSVVRRYLSRTADL